jgi:hypothetical protein
MSKKNPNRNSPTDHSSQNVKKICFIKKLDIPLLTKCETMEEYLKNHPLINITSIEKALGLTHGTLRKGKPIPERHLDRITELLRSYGYDSTVEKEKPAEVIKTTTGKEYVVRRVYKIGIEDKHAYHIGRVEGGLFRKDNDIQDGTRVIIG